MNEHNRQQKIAELLAQREQARLLPGGSQSHEYRKIASKLAYYQNPDTRKKYLASVDPEVTRAKSRARYAADPEYRLKANRAWREKNPGINTQTSRNYRANNPQAKIADRLRSLVRMVGMRRGPSHKTPHALEESVGCTRDQLQSHIEKLFRYDMSWENYGQYWELDHRKPLKSFDLTDPIQLQAANHYTNLRPVTRLENLAKGHKIIVD